MVKVGSLKIINGDLIHLQVIGNGEDERKQSELRENGVDKGTKCNYIYMGQNELFTELRD